MTDPLDWRWDALCAQVDGDLFYPELGGSNRAAKQLCATCPVINQCLTTALENNETEGIWGGTTPKERATMRKAKAA